jgi:hypothetical protein
MTNLYRTDHKKWVTYWCDGNGRDHYIVFNNGGLNEQRIYGSNVKNNWMDTVMKPHHRDAPHKEATAINYTGDGSGRDSYVIFS